MQSLTSIKYGIYLETDEFERVDVPGRFLEFDVVGDTDALHGGLMFPTRLLRTACSLAGHERNVGHSQGCILVHFVRIRQFVHLQIFVFVIPNFVQNLVLGNINLLTNYVNSSEAFGL